jgi:PAS domain S-box-containing protein/putative nucleotidyltransferase with HDIG domain
VQAILSLGSDASLYRALFDQVAVGIAHSTLDGRVLDANPKLCELLGYGRAEMAGRSIGDLTHPEDVERFLRARERTRAGESSYEHNVRLVRQGGEAFWTHIATSLVRTPDGVPAYFISIVQDISREKDAERQIEQQVLRLQKAMRSTIDAIAIIGELRDPYTHGHEHRVGELAAAIAREMGLSPEQTEGIRIAGCLHDVGKICVPVEILTKPTRLRPEEFNLIKVHPQTGYDILKGIEFPWPIAEIVRQHHERMDGSGYPRGLKGAQILLEARIVAVADAVEAMAAHRPYRAGRGIDLALAEMEATRGRLYDGAVVDACLRLFRVRGLQLPTG